MAATTQITKSEVKSADVKAIKDAKPPVPLVTRITDQLKRGAVNGKLTKDELDMIVDLAEALKVFVKA